MTVHHGVSYVRFIDMNWHAGYVVELIEKVQLCTHLIGRHML